MHNILITGGAGFIGANFAHYWTNKNASDKTIILDSLSYASNKNHIQPLIDNESAVFFHEDINNTDLISQILTEHSIDCIVHFAAYSHVDRSISHPDEFIQNNIVGTHSLLKAARAVWLKQKDIDHRFHHISTDEVYGSLCETDPPFLETTPYDPSSPYSASKAASDHLVKAYNRTYGLQISISNCSNNYGPYQHVEKLIPMCIHNILNNLPITIYGNGKQIRDWLYVEDHCKAIDAILLNGKIGQTYNIGGKNELRNIDVIKNICTSVDAYLIDNQLQSLYPNSPIFEGQSSEKLIEFVSDRAGHDFRYAIDQSKIESTLDFTPTQTFEKGLEKTIKWYIENTFKKHQN